MVSGKFGRHRNLLKHVRVTGLRTVRLKVALSDFAVVYIRDLYVVVKNRKCDFFAVTI